MADTDLRVINKAIELMKHTYQLTSNCNRYPKKYRHSLVDRMQILSMDIYEFLPETNRINKGGRSEWMKIMSRCFFVSPVPRV